MSENHKGSTKAVAVVFAASHDNRIKAFSDIYKELEAMIDASLRSLSENRDSRILREDME